MNFKLSKSTRKAFYGFFGCILLTGIILWNPFNWTTPLRNFFYDTFFQWKTGVSSEETKQNVSLSEQSKYDIFIVDIDENSLSKLGSYNEWNRTIHAGVIENLTRGGAAAITLDILFKNADFGKKKSEQAFRALREIYPSEDWSQDSAKWRSKYNEDSLFVEAVARSQNTIVSCMFDHRAAYRHESQWQPLSTSERAKELGFGSAFEKSKASDIEKIEPKDLLDNVFPELAHAGVRMGAVNVYPDQDGVLRRVASFYQFPNPELHPEEPGHLYSTIALNTVLFLFKQKSENVRIENGKYINLGKAFGLYRDSLGLLQTTYPKFTIPMFFALLDKKSVFGTERAQKSIIQIADKVVVSRNEENFIEIETFHGQFLSTRLSEALFFLSQEFSSEKPFPETYTFNESFELKKNETDDTYTLFDLEEEEEATINLYILKTLQYFQKEIQELAQGEILHLSCDLDIFYDQKSKQWRSNFPILSQSILEDIARFSIEDTLRLNIGEEIRFGNEKKVPIDEFARYAVNYQSRYNIDSEKRRFQHLSYYDVTRNRLDPALYQGKIFILGSAAPALADFVNVPHEENFPGVLVHANIIQNILYDDYIISLNEHLALFILIFVAILGTLIGLYANRLISVFSLICIASFLLIGGMLLFNIGIYMDPAGLIFGFGGTFIIAFTIRFYFENQEKRFLNSAFRQYISPELIDEMLSQEIMPSLGGQKSDISAYFTDIAGFSSFSEKIGDPSKLVELLNEYLSAMTDILTSNKGTLDKYEGDAIIAFFGAPMPLPNHRQNACETALSMQKKLGELRKKWIQEKGKWPELVHQMHMRVGINSGEMVTGNMGSTMRKNYTMMGDAVNLAARLESAAKQYGVEIHISENTCEKIEPGTILYRSIDIIRVIGKSEPIKTFELLCFADAPEAPDIEKLVSIWERAREKYLEQKWDEAIQLFTQTLELEPHHPDRDPGSSTTPSHVYLKRCLLYKENPPVKAGEIWDGVYTATKK